MESKCFVFAIIFLFSGVCEFKITLGLIERRSYEIFEAYSENEEMFKSFEIFRRDKRNSDPTKRPGVETEQRPPNLPPVNPRRGVSTSGPTSTSNAPTKTTSVNHITIDDHKYYTSRYESSGANRRWYAFDQGTILHERLSRNEQYSDTIRTTFQFPYYGHLIDYVTITNKGYLFMDEVVHKFNASAQYAAPLMADFTTHNDTQITYVDTGDRFTVQWTNLTFQDKKERKLDLPIFDYSLEILVGQFSFQCSILKDGTIIFAYRHIPALVVELSSVSFPQRVGITDSFRYRIVRHGLFRIGERIYTSIVHNYLFKYHSIDLKMENVKSGSAYIITPLLNCVMLKSCNACVNTPTSFSCVWCPQLGRCSDGIDRHRQIWFAYQCSETNQTTCPAPSTTSTTKKVIQATTRNPSDKSRMTLNSTIAPGAQGKASEMPGTKSVTDPTELPKDIASEGLTKETKPTTSSNSTSPTIQNTVSSEKTTTTQESVKTTSEVTKNVTVIVSKTSGGGKATQTPSTLSTRKDERNGAVDKPLNAAGNQGARSGSGGSDVSSIGVTFIALSVIIVLMALSWFVYAYRHPQTRSGRFLIEHRDPRKWFRNDDGTGGKVHYKTKTMELSES